jgi:hypothetical protein
VNVLDWCVITDGAGEGVGVYGGGGGLGVWVLRELYFLFILS